MNLAPLLMNGLWAGFFATAMAVLFSLPRRALLIPFCCGFVARVSRDLLTAWGASSILSTAIAAAVVVVLAFTLVRRPVISPFVGITGLIPLGATGAVFNAIVGVLQVSSLKGEALTAATLALVTNLSKVFTTTLAIVIGVWVGVALVRTFEQKAQVEPARSEAPRS